MKRQVRRGRDRLKIDMQFQVHEPGDDALTQTRSGRTYSKALPAQPVKKRTVVRGKVITILTLWVPSRIFY